MICILASTFMIPLASALNVAFQIAVLSRSPRPPRMERIGLRLLLCLPIAFLFAGLVTSSRTWFPWYFPYLLGAVSFTPLSLLYGRRTRHWKRRGPATEDGIDSTTSPRAVLLMALVALTVLLGGFGLSGFLHSLPAAHSLARLLYALVFVVPLGVIIALPEIADLVSTREARAPSSVLRRLLYGGVVLALVLFGILAGVATLNEAS